jgi:putative ABC transport system permease protein
MRNWKAEISRRLEAAGHAVDVDIVEELAQHAATEYEAARAEGLQAGEATGRIEALIATWVADGGRLRHRRRPPVTVVEPPPAPASALGGLTRDVIYAARLVRRKPGPALVAALTMALGVGATTVLFSVTWGVLMRPLPWVDADRLVRLAESRQGATRQLRQVMTNGSYLAWQDSPRTITGLAAYTSRTVTLTEAGDPQRIQITRATASLFPLMQAVPERGAVFTEADEAGGKVVVLSHGLWQRIFGGRDDVVGQLVHFDGEGYTIAGVMPRDFAFPGRESQAWVPFKIRPASTPEGGSRIQVFAAIARLKPRVRPEQAAEEATARARNAPDPGMAAIAVFGSKGASDVKAQPVLEAMTSDVRDALIVLLAAVGLLLVTATGNIASVQLARASTRRREFALRAALGAGRRRLARQVLVESLVVGVSGGIAGLGLAALLHRMLPALLPADFPRIDDIAMDWRVAAFSFAVALSASLAFGLLPALQAGRLDLVSDLKEDAGATGNRFGRSRTARVRAAIMTGQVALACILLVGASLLVRTFVAMLNADRGYDASNVLTAVLATPDGLFTSQRRAQLVTETLERLRASPDVVSAGVTNAVPLVPGEALMALTLPPGPGESDPVTVQTAFRVVSPGYFETMGIGIVQGRAFDARDTAASMPVIMVNRAFARKYLAGDPVGRRIPANIYEKPEWEIVGVVDDIRMRPALTEHVQPEMYVSYPQLPDGIASEPTFAVRARHDPERLVSLLRQTIRAQDATAALESVMTMDDRVMGSLARPRLYATVLAAFSAFAVAIAGVGLFGMLSYGVSQRAKELGVRAALGARPGDIIGLVVREGLVITVAGIGVGLGTALVITRWLSAFLYGVAPRDALTFAVVPGVLLLVAAAASFVPARKASRIDPLTVLKSA